MDSLEKPKSSSSTQVSHNDPIVGFEEETKTIMDQLLKGGSKLEVISIVGMGGAGKTTLALSLYNKPSMVNHFVILARCTVSQTYQRRALLLSILEQADKSHRSMSDDQVDDFPEKSHTSISKKKLLNMADDHLDDHLRKSLKAYRYLIVLDDIWDAMVWNDLKRSLPDDGNGSRILITTRNRIVADQIPSKVNELHELSKDSSWELFQKKMHPKGSLPDKLVKIAKRIVKNCKGLPLSIIVIAGILFNIKRTKKRWKQIEESVTSRVLSDPQRNCEAMLELCYIHLENHLRPCFLYMASFPEDQEISVKQLLNRWIGEGFVQDTDSERVEEVAKRYIKDLIEKSLLILVKERFGGGVKTFRLHDLLHDFCLNKAKEEHFFTMLDNRYDSPQPSQDPTRLITNGPWIDGLSFSHHNIQSVISYFHMSASNIENGKELCDMLQLKVLKVGKMISGRFPNISSLVHLRYLAFGLPYLKISELPSTSISRLENLQILILKFDHPITVPDFIWDMMKLRHINIGEEASFEVDGNRLENSSFLLENLRSLSKARVSWTETKWDSKYLRKLSGLQSLSCVFVENDSDDGSDEDDVTDMDYSDERMLRFNDQLTSLKVRNDANWKRRFIGTFQLPIRLVELNLSKFYLTQDDLSVIGRKVVHLEVLKIKNCSVPNGYEWNVDDDEFPNLKVLKLRSFNILTWIISDDSFPNLEQLRVEKCNCIQIPLAFGDLPKLRLISITKCEPSVDDSARRIEKVLHEQENYETRVLIHPKKGSRARGNQKNTLVLGSEPSFDATLGSQLDHIDKDKDKGKYKGTAKGAKSYKNMKLTSDLEDDGYSHQCHPKIVHQIGVILESREDKEVLLNYFKTTGFSDVLKLCKWQKGIHVEFVNWVVENFEGDDMQIRCGPKHVLKLSTSDCQRVYNIPSRGKSVPNTVECDPEAIIAVKKDLAIDDRTEEIAIDDRTEEIVPVQVLYERLQLETNVKKWAKVAILIILGALFAPRSHPQISLSYAEVLLEIDTVGDYNWSGHLLEYMKAGIPRKGVRCPKADFHFLLVNYLDRMGPEPPLETKMFHIPTCEIVDHKQVHGKLKVIHEMIGIKNGITYGWTYTGMATTPLTFDAHTCPEEKVDFYADWVREQIQLFCSTLDTLEDRKKQADLADEEPLARNRQPKKSPQKPKSKRPFGVKGVKIASRPITSSSGEDLLQVVAESSNLASNKEKMVDQDVVVDDPHEEYVNQNEVNADYVATENILSEATINAIGE